MSRYFLLSKLWSALDVAYSEYGNPQLVSDDGQTRSVLFKTLCRYQLIQSFLDEAAPGVSGESRLLWVTIAPPHDVSFGELRKRVTKWLGKSFVSRYYLCYEQTREATQDSDSGFWRCSFFGGFHTHVLVEVSNTVGSAQRSLKNEFYGWNCKIVGCPRRFVCDKLRYMQGHKVTEKKAKLEADSIWRASIELLPFYSLGSWPEEADVDDVSRNEDRETLSVADDDGCVTGN